MDAKNWRSSLTGKNEAFCPTFLLEELSLLSVYIWAMSTTVCTHLHTYPPTLQQSGIFFLLLSVHKNKENPSQEKSTELIVQTGIMPLLQQSNVR